jgi:dTDP-4-dehydrorhamnose reductase
VTTIVPVLVFGGTGQIGYEIVRRLAWLGPVTAPTRNDVNLENVGAVREVLRRTKPGLVVNAAAYTGVDAAESNVDACMRLNAHLPSLLADECARLGATLVHFSSDYVFDGTKTTPYTETDQPNPLSVYGVSKLAGDRAVEASHAPHLIFRTSWVYAARGRNFALTMLRLGRERDELLVVNDQIGSPTSAPAIAAGVSDVFRTLAGDATLREAAERASGVYNLTAAGSTTWFEFAKAVLAADPRRSEQRCRVIHPITTAEYRVAAKRPAYSLLDNTKLAERFGIRLASWADEWRSVARTLEAPRDS